VSKETGSTTNLYRTGYAYSYLTYGRQLVRTEQDYSGGWNDSWRATYQWDAMERQDSEEREDWSGSSWDSEYLIQQEYDKNGNRTGNGNRPGMICDEIEAQSRRLIASAIPVRQRRGLGYRPGMICNESVSQSRSLIASAIPVRLRRAVR